MADAARARTVTWDDPSASRAAVDGLSGLDALRRFRDDGRVAAPVSSLIGMRVTAAEPGFAAFAIASAEFLENPFGVMHGGIVATLLDSAMGSAVWTTLAPDLAYTTIEMKVNLLRPVTRESGEVVAEGRVLHRGRRTALAEASARDAGGRLVAHATSTCMIFPHTA